MANNWKILISATSFLLLLMFESSVSAIDCSGQYECDCSSGGPQECAVNPDLQGQGCDPYGNTWSCYPVPTI